MKLTPKQQLEKLKQVEELLAKAMVELITLNKLLQVEKEKLQQLV